MKKEYTKLTIEKLDENKQSTGEIEEVIHTALIADVGKVFYCKETGFTGGKRIDIGSADSEENYTEVDDPNFVEVIESLVSEVSGEDY